MHVHSSNPKILILTNNKSVGRDCTSLGTPDNWIKLTPQLPVRDGEDVIVTCIGTTRVVTGSRSMKCVDGTFDYTVLPSCKHAGTVYSLPYSGTVSM